MGKFYTTKSHVVVFLFSPSKNHYSFQLESSTMGKARKVKSHSHKVNPTALVNLNNVTLNDEFLDDENQGSPILAIVDQLQSASVEEKMCGLQTLATICQNEQNIPAIIESDLVKIAASLLVDNNVSIRQSTAGALRNLSLVSVKICEYLVDQDTLTPLLALLDKYATDTDWIPVIDKNMQDQLDEKSDTFLQSVNLLWNLCESTSVALDSFNQTHLLQSFVKCLNWSVYGRDISVAVAQCLLVISEDNPAAWKVLAECGNELTNLLPLDGDSTNVLLRTVAAGIIANVPVLSATFLGRILPTLSKTLEINHRTNLNDITSSLPLVNRPEVAQEVEIEEDIQMENETDEAASHRRRKADLPSELELKVKDVGYLLLAQRIAAEILTNICSSEEDTEWQDHMDEDMSDAESVHDYDKAALNDSIQNTDRLPVEVLEAIKSLGLVEKLWQKAQPVAENVTEILKEHGKNLYNRLISLRVSSLLCLHNLCNSIATEELGGAQGLYNVWLDLGQQVFQGQQNSKLLEASTSLMRAALEHLKQSPELFKQMTDNDLQLMLTGVKECTDTEIKANWLKMLGILGCLLPEALVKVIVDFILNTCSMEDDVWALSEALDSMMDMFSDNDWHQVVYELNMIVKCKELERNLKIKIKQQKRELNERYPAVCTVRTNLTRFCKYLEQEMRNFKPNTEV